ncbi:carbohydrate binding domain-containing protein [Thalassotalea sp. PLHSN55]|uniref:carbohydrate binding domain-containing protein n=1 Tax=Thalassotalea sp. PLHSN55 TaxID=3435888 RepID=UPI003F82DE18
MKYQLKHLALATALVMPLSSLAQSNLIVNGDFEEGDKGSFANITIPGWTHVGTSGWHHGRAEETIGEKTVKLKNSNTYIFQEVSISAGSQYDISAQVTSFSRQALLDREAILSVQWLAGSTVIDTDIIGSYVGGVDNYDQWKLLNKTLTAPTNATLAKITFSVDDIGATPEKHVHIDEVTMTLHDDNGEVTVGYFEDFNQIGQPTTIQGTWRYVDDMLPVYGWNEIVPGDGYAYLTIDANADNDQDSSQPFQDIRFSEVGPGNRIEMRAKNLAISGVGGFIFTYQEDATSFDEIDIEVAYDDIKTAATNGNWSDARFNSWGNANPYGPYEPVVSIKEPVKDEFGNKISVEDDQFHTFTIEWQHYDGINGRIDFYIDGAYQATITDVVGDDLSEIILGYRQMSWTGDLDWSGTRTMVIDWFRVSPVHDNSPDAIIDRYNAISEQALVITPEQGVQVNDEQQNGLTSQLLSQPQHGTVTLNSDGSFTYLPNNGYSGEDNFVYKNSSNKGESNAAVVKITVVNQGGGNDILVNGDFEAGTAPWSYYKARRVNYQSNDGSFAAEIDAGGDVINVVNNLTPNTTYKVSAKIKTTGQAALYVRNYGGDKLKNATSSASYTNKSITFTTGENITSADIYVYASSGNTYADTFIIEEVQ